MQQPALLAIDWGTSNLRCWLLDKSGDVLATKRSDQGMSRLSPSDYTPLLQEIIRDLMPQLNQKIPIVLCGMVGAASGWHEAPYLKVPARFADLASHCVALSHDGHEVRIIGGLSQNKEECPDVMRGEETLLYGAFLAENLTDNSVVILPGTHAKWVRLSDGGIHQFSTSMTGELYHLLSQYSLLASILDPDDFDEGVFCAALDEAYQAPERALSQLFALRAGTLLGTHSARAPSSRLSGLLIGAEIATNYNAFGGRIVLIASGRTAALYHSALSHLRIDHEMHEAETYAQTALYHIAKDIWPAAFD